MATKHRVSSVLIFCLLLTVACNSMEEQEMSSVYKSPEFQEFVELHCKARILKNERFELADKIRKNQIDLPAEAIDSLKHIKASNSRMLADSISAMISQLSGKMTPAEKRAFNDSIESRIEKMKCDT